MNKRYPRAESRVIVTFVNGDVKEYIISAGVGISGYLARESSQTGVLSLWSENASHGIPLVSIRDWTIEALWVEEVVNEQVEENKQEQSRTDRGSTKSLDDDIPF